MSNQDWKADLARVVRGSKCQVIGWARIEYIQHAKLVCTALRAFGDDARAVFYIEGLASQGKIPRPDLIILHPEIGILVIENKGVKLEEVVDVHDTQMNLVRNGVLKTEDPFQQADRVMYGLKDLCKVRFNVEEGLFLRMVAFPLIRRSEIELRFKVGFPQETLFSGACTDAVFFREQVLAYSAAGQRTTGKKTKLSNRAKKEVMTILSGRSIFTPARQRWIEDQNVRLLGMQVQELELGLKEPTQQQREIGGADHRGTHRLFRGVAGSGKSIMLALNVSNAMVLFEEESVTLFGESGKEKRVLVCCYNKSLVQYLAGKIEDAYGRLAWKAPSEAVLTVTHFEGLVRGVESRHGGMVTGLDFMKKVERAKSLCERFDRLDVKERDGIVFDAVYVDEAQDLLPEELEFLRRLARRSEDGKQTLSIFYDNAQNIYGVTAPTWEKLGIHIVGRTVFMDQCLRNTKETLLLAFNILVGAFAADGVKVVTKQFADVGSLKQRGLIRENGDRYEILFSERSGPIPQVSSFLNRQAEIDGVISTIKTLVTKEKVLPSDILVLYQSHYSFKPLGKKLQEVIGAGYEVRLVDSGHGGNKKKMLVEEGVLTVSTIASAKGYDAPVVFVLGADELENNEKGRAQFYVAATRAKLGLFVSGVRRDGAELLEEILLTSEMLSERKVVRVPPVVMAGGKDLVGVKGAMGNVHRCSHCGSEKLHAQTGRFGYFFQCIECMENTPMDLGCANCGKRGRIRERGFEFFQECAGCGVSNLVHTNVALDSL